jgi:hypothetical protein
VRVEIFTTSDAVVFFPTGSFFSRFPHSGNFARQPRHYARASRPRRQRQRGAFFCFCPSKPCWRRGSLSRYLLAKKLQAGEAATKLGDQPRSPAVPPRAPKLSPPPARPRWGAAHATAKMLRRQPSFLEWASFDARRLLGKFSDRGSQRLGTSEFAMPAVCSLSAQLYPGYWVLLESHAA